jgi:hypothetical protein
MAMEHSDWSGFLKKTRQLREKFRVAWSSLTSVATLTQVIDRALPALLALGTIERPVASIDG